VEEAKRPLPDLTAKELTELWDKLGHEDPMQAYRAMRRLAASPKQSVPLLRERFAAHLKAQLALAALVAQLDEDKFAVRQKAQEALLAAGDDAIPALHKALVKPPSAEARQRLEKLLAQLETGRLPDPATRRLLWAVELCEHLGTADAKKALEALAQGDADAWLTREARATLDRLTKKQPHAGPVRRMPQTGRNLRRSLAHALPARRPPADVLLRVRRLPARRKPQDAVELIFVGLVHLCQSQLHRFLCPV
jgi:hypothetical protein